MNVPLPLTIGIDRFSFSVVNIERREKRFFERRSPIFRPNQSTLLLGCGTKILIDRLKFDEDKHSRLS